MSKGKCTQVLIEQSSSSSEFQLPDKKDIPQPEQDALLIL